MVLLKRIVMVVGLVLLSGYGYSYDYPRTDKKLVPLAMTCYQPGLVALTFDDGPSGNFPYLLDVLKRHEVKATFFLLGKKLTYPVHVERALAAVADGHQIENHGWDHTRFTHLSKEGVIEQVNMTNQILWDKLGVVARFVRAPHGQIDAKRAIGIWDLDQGIASWNLDPKDYKTGPLWTPERVLAQVREAIDAASPDTDSFIIDLHDASDTSIQVLESMILLIREAGFRIVSLDECVDQGRDS